MYCPRCGDKLTIYDENRPGYRWLYRQYICLQCKTIWNWASDILRVNSWNESTWKIEESHAWNAVGIPILEEHKHL